MSSHNRGGSVKAGFLGIVVGGAVGFALGMMLAPEEGRKLRRRLAFQLDHLSRKIGEVIESLGDDSVLSEARQKGETLVADVEQRARRIQEDMDDLPARLPGESSSGPGSRRRQPDPQS